MQLTIGGFRHSPLTAYALVAFILQVARSLYEVIPLPEAPTKPWDLSAQASQALKSGYETSNTVAVSYFSQAFPW